MNDVYNFLNTSLISSFTRAFVMELKSPVPYFIPTFDHNNNKLLTVFNLPLSNPPTKTPVSAESQMLQPDS